MHNKQFKYVHDLLEINMRIRFHVEMYIYLDKLCEIYVFGKPCSKGF